MASDRWRSLHEPKSRFSVPDEKTKSSGINPSVFYTRRHKKAAPLTASEQQLDEILHLAARNEVTQRRHEFSKIQKLQREAYREVTTLKIFPLQDMAFEYFTDMRREYLGLSADEEQHEDVVDTIEDDELCDQSPSERVKRIKVEGQWGEDMDRVKEQYRAMFLKEMHHIPQKFLPDLWSMEPRIFALETSSGKRKYVVGNLGRFLQHYWRDTDQRCRHYYELIPEGTPCRLYFDLEFSKVYNQISALESEVFMTEFIDELCHEFRVVHDIKMSRACVIDLDSSTEKKFSRHLIIHLPNGELFADAYSAGLFVKRFVGRLADELSTGMLQISHATLAKCLFVRNQASQSPEQKSLEAEKSGQTYDNGTNNQQERVEKLSCFVDLGVYTRNRLFRLLGSCKWGKSASAALRIADANEFCFPTGFSNSKFYFPDRAPLNQSTDTISAESAISTDTTTRDKDHEAFCAALDWEMHARALTMTLVVPANGSKVNSPILTDQYDDGENIAQTTIPSSGRRNKSQFRTCNGASPIHMLDTFFLQLSQRGGIQGKIRAWSHEGPYFFYQMSDNRWCEHIGRAHKSNNIIWNVDLACKNYWQTCHDPDCRAANFRGVKTQLPEELASLIDDYLLDQELGALDEEKVMIEATAMLGRSELHRSLM